MSRFDCIINSDWPNNINVFEKNISSLPWIPFEYHNNMELAKHDFKAEIWSYATALWEIFSRGRTPTLKEVFKLSK